MTLEAGLRALLDEYVHVERRVGDDDPIRRDVDAYGNESDHWLPVPNPNPDDPENPNDWPAGIEGRFTSVVEDTTDRDVGAVTYRVTLTPENPITRTDRIRRSDGTLLHPVLVNRYTGGGGAHVEIRATEIT